MALWGWGGGGILRCSRDGTEENGNRISKDMYASEHNRKQEQKKSIELNGKGLEVS